MNSRHKIQDASISVTKWVGSVPSIILHTFFFIGCFGAAFFGFLSFDRMLLVLTTLVSLEAIYLAIFIQMSLNLARESLAEVEHDVEEIHEDVEGIQEDVSEIEKDIDEIQEDIEEQNPVSSS